jgi:hypothetical protein
MQNPGRGFTRKKPQAPNRFHPADPRFKVLQDPECTRHLKRAPASHAESGTRIHAKKGELLRIDSILPSDDQALEEVGLIAVDSLKFA